LRCAWAETYERLRDAVARDPTLIREQWRWLVEQLSLGCGIVSHDLPWRALPPEMNFPSHVRVPADAILTHPVIVHYHGDHDASGFLLRSRTPELDPFLDRFNRRRAELTGAPYDGMQRASLRRRLHRAGMDWLWDQLADRGWYRSPAATELRRRVKRAIASGN
jgi:hypothetical protein